ncbi:MAG: arginase [Salinirussus sp.]
MDRTARLVGVPMDLGADRRGVDMGPSAIRYAGLADQLHGMGIECIDGGDISVPNPEERDPEPTMLGGGRAKFLEETGAVCQALGTTVAESIAADQLPLVLGGDHSIAIGTANGLARDSNIGVLWFDAHGDYNLPATSPSGNVHGMSLAALLGEGPFADLAWAGAEGVAIENVSWIGLRDLDGEERERVRASAGAAYTMSDLDRRGVAPVVEEAIEMALDGTDGLMLSLDMDWLDPAAAPGVGTPVRGGVSYREAHVAMELVASRARDDLAAMEVVEVNPILDRSNATAELACELVASALGKRTL